MPGIHRIVVATDFSAAAEQAVQRAARIAQAQQAELHLIHVVRPLDLYPGLTWGPDELGQHDEALRHSEQSLLEEQAAVLGDAFGIRVQAATLLGRVHNEIAAYAKEVAADLVVSGARGENSLLDLVLGSTASRLLRVATCPVLIVRKPAAEPYGKVLAAVDFSPVSAQVLAQALEIAGDAQVDVVHVLGSEVERRLRKAKLAGVDVADWLERQRSEAGRHLDTLLSALGGGRTVGRRLLPGLASAVICQEIEDTEADLVVLGRHGYGGGLQDWMLGSVSKDVALAASCDVLLIHPGGAA